MNKIIRTIYLYVAVLIGLIMVLFGAGKLIDVGLEYFIPDVQAQTSTVREIPPKEPYKRNQTRRDIRDGIALLLVGTPVLLIHGRIIKKSKYAV